MKINRTRAFLLAALSGLMFFAAFLPFAQAATLRYGDINISAQPPLPGKSSHGYAEYTFLIQNKSLERQHVVTLQMPKRDNGYGSRLFPLSRTVKIAPGATMKMRLYQPHITLPGYLVEVFVDRKSAGLNNTLPFSRSDMLGYTNDSEFLITKSAMSTNPPELKSGSGKVYVMSNVPVNEWSDNWLAFSRYPLIIATGEDIARMSSATRTALMNYVECGGSLIVGGRLDTLNSIDAFTAWKKFKKAERGWDVYNVGFGRVFTTSKTFKKIPRGNWNFIFRGTQFTKVILGEPGRTALSSANRKFPVVKKISYSPGIIFFIMFIFAILIGPVNIYILSKKKRKIWLLWTVPAGALVFTLIVLLYVLASENWGGYTRSRTLTLLNENSHRATSLGRLAYYYPVPPSDGLRFSDTTEISTYSGNNSGRVYAVDWTNGQHLRSGWLVAKTPCHLRLRKNESRRERLEVKRHGGKVTVTNGLGAYIKKLTLWDFDNKQYSASNINPGKTVELKPESSGGLRIYELNNYLNGFDLLPYRDFKFHPGSYLAELESNPFVEPGREASKTHRDEASVIGIMRKEGR